jgi:bifunctional non-homologous end joining protein LigD
MSPTFTICGQQIDVDNKDKIFFPSTEGASAVTKGDVVTYYRDIASLIVPHLRGRPITLERFPDGIKPINLIGFRP